MLGGIVGATLVWLMYLPHWKATKDRGAKLGVFSTAPAIKIILLTFKCIELLFLSLGIFIYWGK